jgi:WD40 repeat protein
MRGKKSFEWMAALAVLLLAHGASSQQQTYRLREIFVPQTSEFTQHHPGAVNSFDLSPDGKTLAVEFGTQEPDKTKGKWVALWDVDRQRLIGTQQVDQNIPPIVWYTTKIRFSPDGRMLVVLTGPHLVALSFPELKILYAVEDRVLPENAEQQMFIEGFSIVSNRLAILQQYNHNSDHDSSLEVKIADLDSARLLASWTRPGMSRSIALSPDASLLALAINPVPFGVRNIPAGENNVFLIKSDSGQVVRAFNSGSSVSNAEFVGGKTVMTVPDSTAFESQDAVKVWDINTGRMEEKLGYAKYGLRGDTSISADGRLLAVAAIWLNPEDVRFDRDNPRGGARLLLWSLPSAKLAYRSEKLGWKYDLGESPIMVGDSWLVLVRMSESGSRVAVGGALISVYSLESAPVRADK